MPPLFVRFCYNLLIYLALLPVLLYLLLRSRKDPAYRQRLAERFAWQRVPQQALGGLVVHAVSVGEVVAATPLIHALQRQYPGLPITVTCSTPTGSARIVSSFADAVYHCYMPLDTPTAINRFLTKLQPQAVIILETELWPNLLQQCRRALIPAIVVNARLSARSAKGYRRWFAFSRLALDNISLLLAQDDASARRFAALKTAAQIQVCGNLSVTFSRMMSAQLTGASSMRVFFSLIHLLSSKIFPKSTIAANSSLTFSRENCICSIAWGRSSEGPSYGYETCPIRST